MDGQIDGQMEGWTDGWMDGWMDGQMERWMNGRIMENIRQAAVPWLRAGSRLYTLHLLSEKQ